MLLDFWSDSRWVNVRLNQKKNGKTKYEWISGRALIWLIFHDFHDNFKSTLIASNEELLGATWNGQWRAADGAKWDFVVNKPKNAELAAEI